jgi:ribonuclease HII
VKDLGVQDSKTLTPERRLELDERIRATAAHVELVEVAAGELNQRMKRRNLNDVEVEVFGELGRRVPADVYYLDACDVIAARFGRRFLARLERPPPRPKIVSEHHADANHALVSAASIVAKVRRDAAIRKIANRLEPAIGLPLGSGYAHDPRTRAFLERYIHVHGKLPDEARASWATSRTMLSAHFQTTLG